jgi:diguanylate cyclase (GGDEF)-like protein
MEKLVYVVQALSIARSMESLQRIVRTAARDLTGADGASFVLRDGSQCYYADEDAIEPLWKGRRFPMEVCISGWVMTNRKPVVIEDIYSDPRIPTVAYRPTFVKSLAMVPIRTLDPIGAIGNYWAATHRPTDEDIQVLQALADSTAVQMESISILATLEDRIRQRTQELQTASAENQRLSIIDELTGLHNRRGFFQLAEQQRMAARHRGAELFLLYIDVDGLKPVNDTQGHEAGDQMLRALAEVLRKAFRASDLLARLSGDEFCVLGIYSGGASAQYKQRFVDCMAAYNASHSAPWQLAASVGIVSFSPDHGGSLETALAEADKAMYAEKLERRAMLAQRPLNADAEGEAAA